MHEAAWRIFGFEIHQQRPAVQKVIIHLKDEQNLVFQASKSPEDVLSRPSVHRTMFTEWMETNKRSEEARKLTYVQFPTRFVWNTSTKLWTERQRGSTIGRIVNIHPAAGEKYYMRILLNHVKGATSFEDIRTVGSVTYKSYKEACFARGLLDGDKEWQEALEEASYWASAVQLKKLFVTLLLYCEVSKPRNLWTNFWPQLSKDISFNQRRKFNFTEWNLTDTEIEQYTLVELEKLLIQSNKSLSDFPDMPIPEKNIMNELTNSLLKEEMNYNINKEKTEHARLLSTLNSDQQIVYNSVMDSIEHSKGKLFFLYGPGGTGKTYVYKTIISKLRSMRRIVLPVATSGIAATLLPGGRTAHSRFKIPIDLHEHSMCDIKPRTMLAELIEQTSLIIWDEAPMAHRHTFEALDRTLRDIKSIKDPAAIHKEFGGITVLLGGDFRQILPVIPQGSRQDTVLATINRSYLWDRRNVCVLGKNMRLKEEEITFAKWILNVGDGVAKKPTS